MKKRILPHEPGEELLGVKEALEDAERLREIMEKKAKKRKEVLERLRSQGVRTVAPRDERI